MNHTYIVQGILKNQRKNDRIIFKFDNEKEIYGIINLDEKSFVWTIRCFCNTKYVNLQKYNTSKKLSRESAHNASLILPSRKFYNSIPRRYRSQRSMSRNGEGRHPTAIQHWHWVINHASILDDIPLPHPRDWYTSLTESPTTRRKNLALFPRQINVPHLSIVDGIGSPGLSLNCHELLITHHRATTTRLFLPSSPWRWHVIHPHLL